jgi:hypothetical protein
MFLQVIAAGIKSLLSDVEIKSDIDELQMAHATFIHQIREGAFLNGRVRDFLVFQMSQRG